MQQDRREAKFWECRKSLSLWPVDCDRDSVITFLKEKIRMDDNFVEDIGELSIRKIVDPDLSLRVK